MIYWKRELLQTTLGTWKYRQSIVIQCCDLYAHLW